MEHKTGNTSHCRENYRRVGPALLILPLVDVIELGDEKAPVLKDKIAKEEALERGEEPDEKWERRL